MFKTRTWVTLLVGILFCVILLQINFNLTFISFISKNNSGVNKVFDCITWNELPFGSKNTFIKNVNMHIQNDSESHLHRLKSWIKVKLNQLKIKLVFGLDFPLGIQTLVPGFWVMRIKIKCAVFCSTKMSCLYLRYTTCDKMIKIVYVKFSSIPF